MADAPSHAAGGLQALTRKAGPLPVWAWVGLIGVAYLAYRHFHGSTPSAQPAGTTDQSYVPPFDSAMSGGGGIGTNPAMPIPPVPVPGGTSGDGGGGGGTVPPPSPNGNPATSGIHYFGPGGSGTYYPPAYTTPAGGGGYQAPTYTSPYVPPSNRVSQPLDTFTAV